MGGSFLELPGIGVCLGLAVARSFLLVVLESLIRSIAVYEQDGWELGSHT